MEWATSFNVTLVRDCADGASDEDVSDENVSDEEALVEEDFAVTDFSPSFFLLHPARRHTARTVMDKIRRRCLFRFIKDSHMWICYSIL